MTRNRPRRLCHLYDVANRRIHALGRALRLFLIVIAASLLSDQRSINIVNISAFQGRYCRNTSPTRCRRCRIMKILDEQKVSAEIRDFHLKLEVL